MAEVICPFCGFKGNGEYEIQLHIEQHHTEDSPFVVNEDATILPSVPVPKGATPSEESMPKDTWTKCTRPGCGQYVLLVDVDDHLEVHEAIEAVERDEKDSETSKGRRSPNSRRSRSNSEVSRTDSRRSPQKLQKPKPNDYNGSSLRKYFTGTSYKGRPAPTRRPVRKPLEPGRLGKRELGPHAFEKVMPVDVRRHLLNDALPRYTNRIGRDGRLYREATVENETSGLINILADLCALDPETEATYLCNPSVRHVTKLRCDGNFCGYWNIQMLLSYLHAKRPPNSQAAPEPLPNILQIQDIIEQAWDNGICPYGRIETGGVRGTRKWIGTHEAVAFFTQAGVGVEALCFRKDEGEDSASQPAVLDLLDHIEAYFISGLEGAKQHRTSYITSLAPIYFQRFGHSMTIVGIERKRDGWRNLLVFDPSFDTADEMRRLLANKRSYVAPETLLKAYRRSDLALSRWEEFEIVVPQPPKANSKS